MYVQATISCECGCVSRVDIQEGKTGYICPNCKKAMYDDSFQQLLVIMGQLSDWNHDVTWNATGLGKPKMRAITLSVADLES